MHVNLNVHIEMSLLYCSVALFAVLCAVDGWLCAVEAKGTKDVKQSKDPNSTSISSNAQDSFA